MPNTYYKLWYKPQRCAVGMAKSVFRLTICKSSSYKNVQPENHCNSDW